MTGNIAKKKKKHKEGRRGWGNPLKALKARRGGVQPGKKNDCRN